jgi:hypothetical protein
MRLFKNLFQKKDGQQQPETVIPTQELFIDNEAPRSFETEKKLGSPIFTFLDENHFSAGLFAGYHLHCHDGLKSHLSQLRARFREAVDSLIGSLENQLTEKEMMSIQIGDMMPSQKQCLLVSLDLTKKQIEEAKLQKVLSIDDEGWISSAVNSFKLGFQKGMMDHFNEKDFFKEL